MREFVSGQKFLPPTFVCSFSERGNRKISCNVIMLSNLCIYAYGFTQISCQMILEEHYRRLEDVFAIVASKTTAELSLKRVNAMRRCRAFRSAFTSAFYFGSSFFPSPPLLFLLKRKDSASRGWVDGNPFTTPGSEYVEIENSHT